MQIRYTQLLSNLYITGTCRIALIMHRDHTAESSWSDVARTVDRITRCPNHTGFMRKGDPHGPRSQLGLSHDSFLTSWIN